MTDRTLPPRRVRAALAAALLLALSALLSSAPTAFAGVGDVVYGPCRGLSVAARCGRITVPLVRANPALGTTEVAFALVTRRAADEPSQGTIAYNPGGPGAATIAQGDDLAGGLFAPLRDHRDLLLLDVRGTGQSQVLSCSALSPELVFGPAAAANAATGACGGQLGGRIAGYGSAEVADDLDDVRAALGIDRLDLWGESWGTYLMPVYAARHAAHVRSIVLSGAYPLDFDPWGRDQIAAARRAIRLACARTRRCDGARVLRRTARLARRLRTHPVATTVRVGGDLVPYELGEGAIASLLYAPLDASVFGRIPAAVDSALAGDLAPLKRLNEHSLALFSLLRSQDPRVLATFSSAANAAISCHDYPRVYSFADPVPARKAAYADALARLDPRAFRPVSPAAWAESGIEGADTCIEWPDDPSAGRPLPSGTAMPDVPVLVLSGDLDTNTPSSMGRQAAAQFPHARFAEVPNAGHTPSDVACGAALGLRFVKTLSANVRACAGTGTPPPFVTSPPRRPAGIVPSSGSGTLAQRKALGLVQLTVADLADAHDLIDAWDGASGLRGGRYLATAAGPVKLVGVRIVSGARVSGSLALDEETGGVAGTVRLRGRGVLSGDLSIALRGDGRGTATGTLGGETVSLRFS